MVTGPAGGRARRKKKGGYEGPGLNKKERGWNGNMRL
jgi:hypothetical protein